MLQSRIATQTVDRPVYICGLPRAGTTITLQMLSEHPDVVTHKYADFLMPYMPYVWNQVFPRIPGRCDAQTGAPHSPRPDQVTRDSAEMGEEILWEHFFPFIHDESEVQRPRRLDLEPRLRALLRRSSAQARAGSRPHALREQSDHVRRAHAVLARASFPMRASYSTSATRSITSRR